MDGLYIAVDLGAGSGRVFLAGLAADEFLLEEVRRFHYPPRMEDGHLRWDFAHIFAEIKAGLRAGGERARALGRAVVSLGVDSWGVDYGLLDADGALVENPVCYRDARTNGVPEQVFEIVSRDTVFTRTGIQFLQFNTLFQLFAHTRAGLAERAEKLLLMPDLINFYLTGVQFAEFTNATTTQMLAVADKNWDFALLEKLAVPTRLLPDIINAGTQVGRLKRALAQELNLPELRVVAPATHDTGSAVAGAPLAKNWAYISSGTWSLVGVELSQPLINADVARANFTNEGGAGGTFRFLKNVMGLWLLEACRKEWTAARGRKIDYEKLLAEVVALKDYEALIYPDDARFLNPPSMTAALAQQLEESGQTMPDDPARVTKMILDSLALRYASVLSRIEKLTGDKIVGVQIVGGGGKNDYLNQMTADAAQLTVKAGLAEATVTGNVIVQALAAGRFNSLTEAREYVARNVELKTYEPRSAAAQLDAARTRYVELEARLGN